MKILVTGGAGFIASNITDRYVELGHDVVVVDDLSSGKREYVNKGAKFYKCDIRAKEIEGIFRKEKPELVSHHAAQIDVRKSVEDPLFDASVNVVGTINIGENCVRYDVKKLIFSSSGGAIYGEVKRPAKETDSPHPISPYAINKHTAEQYIQYWQEIYGLKYTILRYGNVYGPRQAGGEAGVISIFIQRMMADKQVAIFGDGRQIRDYVNVGDVVKANVASLSKGGNKTYNIGTGKGTSVNALFDGLSRILGYNKKPNYTAPRKGEVFKNLLNIDKAKRELGLAPISIGKGLELTVGWFKKN